ncbi:hypothetical protein Taro_055349, partial [Colocasia esculenta]|nr:hypothetical protein [Colocasia esculenta]
MAMTGGASTLFTLMERIAHKMGMFCVGAPARDPRGARHGPAAVCLQVFVLWYLEIVGTCTFEGTDFSWYIVYQRFQVLRWNCAPWRSCGETFLPLCYTLTRLVESLWQACTTSSCVVVVLCELVLPRGMPQLSFIFLLDTYVRYPLRDFGPFAGGGSRYGALLGINTPFHHTFDEFDADLCREKEDGEFLEGEDAKDQEEKESATKKNSDDCDVQEP